MNLILKRLLICVLLLPGMIYAQDGKFVLKGKVGNMSSPAKAYLCLEIGVKEIWDSVYLQEGAFEFKGTIERPALANICIYPGTGKTYDKRKFYLVEGSNLINGRELLAGAVISGDGAKINKDFDSLRPMLDYFNRQYDSVTVDDPLEKMNAYNKIEERFDHSKMQYIRTHPDSYFSLRMLADLSKKEFLSTDTAIHLYEMLSNELKMSVSGQEVNVDIKKRKLVVLGAQAPDFTQSDVRDSLISLSDFRGKYVLLEFWASWCKPCREEAPYLVAAYKKYKDAGFSILSVSIDEADKKERWLKAIAQDGTGEWSQVLAPGSLKNVADDYSVRSIPANFLIDPQGRIVAKDLRGLMLEEKLSRLLKK